MEDELFDYGTFKLRKDALIHNIKNNIDSYIAYKRLDGEDAENLRTAVNYIIQGVDNGSITKDLEYIPKHKDDFWFKDSSGNLDDNNKWHNEALKFLNIIANSQGKLAGNKKATEEKEEDPKEYTNFMDYLAKSLYPNAKGINDPDIDWSNIAKNYNGDISKFWKDNLVKFSQDSTINRDPKNETQLKTILENLENGIDASDYIEMNKAGIPATYYNYIAKKLEVPTDSPAPTGQVTEEVIKTAQEEQPENFTAEDVFKALGPVALDIYSIASPEPVTSTIAGLTSDFLNWVNDPNAGKNWKTHAFNVAATGLGIIPYAGDSLNLVKLSNKLKGLTKYLGPIFKYGAPTVGIALTSQYGGDAWEFAKESYNKLQQGEDLNIQDYKNIGSVILASLNLLKSGKALYNTNKIGNQTRFEEGSVSVVDKNNVRHVFQGSDADKIKNIQNIDELNDALKDFNIEAITLPSTKTTYNTARARQLAENYGKRTQRMVEGKTKQETKLVRNNNSTQNPPTTPPARRNIKNELDTKGISIEDQEAIEQALRALHTGKKSFKERLKTLSGIRNTKEYKTALNLLIEKGKYTRSEAEQILKELEAFKQGGVIKAQDGVKVPAWFNNIWAHTQLYGWTPELRKDKWKQQVGFHGDANSLESVYNANTNYTSDKDAVTGDIQNYYSSGTYANKQAFMNAYNNDIDSLNNFFVQKREYGSDAGNHANIFKNVYKSRSGSGNLNYDLGYQEDLSPIMGSTMWHRRADRYEKKFDELSDSEKKNRIHKIKLSDGTESYVYKKYNGQIADITDDEAKRILAITEEPSQETSTQNITTTGNRTESGAGPGKGDKEPPIIKEEPVVVPKESSELSKNLPFTLAGFLDATNVNKEIRDKQGEMTTPLQDPIHLNRNVYGNLRAIAEANKRGAQRNALVKSMFTSDNSQNMAMLYDTFNKNMEDFQQALAVDDATMRETSERSLAEKKEEYLRNHETFWGNKQRLSQLHNEGVLSDMAYLTAQHQSRKNLLDELKTYTLADVRRNEQYKRAAAQNKLWQHIQRTPGSYIVGWNTEDEKLWNRYQSGENIINPVEKQRLQQINQLIQEAYQQGLYPDSTIWSRPNMNSIRLGVYSPTGVVASVKRGAKLVPYMRKKGGTITKDMTDAIIKYLKESNKNYNKSIDRSVRGLYNSIKLQRNKK